MVPRQCLMKLVKTVVFAVACFGVICLRRLRGLAVWSYSGWASLCISSERGRGLSSALGNLMWMSRICWQTSLFHLWTVNSELVHAFKPTWLKFSCLAPRKRFNQLSYRSHRGLPREQTETIIGILIQISLFESHPTETWDILLNLYT